MFQLPPLTPSVRAMLFASLGLFVLTALLENFAGIPVVVWLALETRQLTPLTALQLLTHLWVVSPGGLALVVLAANCFFLWLIGAPFEARYGTRRTVELTLVAALSAGIPALLVGMLLPRMAIPLAGPQTITLCLVSAYRLMLPPNARLNFFGWMASPRELLWVLLGLALVGFLNQPVASSLAADLGAIGGGAAFVRFWMQRPPSRKGPKKASGRLRVVRDDDDPNPGRWLN